MRQNFTHTRRKPPKSLCSLLPPGRHVPKRKTHTITNSVVTLCPGYGSVIPWTVSERYGFFKAELVNTYAVFWENAPNLLCRRSIRLFLTPSGSTETCLCQRHSDGLGHKRGGKPSPCDYRRHGCRRV